MGEAATDVDTIEFVTVDKKNRICISAFLYKLGIPLKRKFGEKYIVACLAKGDFVFLVSAKRAVEDKLENIVREAYKEATK